MQILDTTRRLAEAFITALAVFFGLEQDPTLVPIEVERDVPLPRR